VQIGSCPIAHLFMQIHPFMEASRQVLRQAAAVLSDRSFNLVPPDIVVGDVEELEYLREDSEAVGRHPLGLDHQKRRTQLEVLEPVEELLRVHTF